MKLVCTDRGQHKERVLARVTYVITADPDDPVMRGRDVVLVSTTRRGQSADYYLRGDELAEYNMGRGDFAGYPLEVRALTLLPGKGTPRRRHVMPVAEIRRTDGQVTRILTCPSRGRVHLDMKLTEAQLRRLGELDVNVFDLSQWR